MIKNNTLSRIKNLLVNLKGETKLLLNIFLIATALSTFIYVAQEVKRGNTRDFDNWILSSLRVDVEEKVPIGPEWLNVLMTDITALGGAAITAMITAAVVIYLLLKKNYSFLWLILLATVGGAVISLGLKELFSRERPPVEYHLLTVKSLSFPSGHATMSSVVYLTQGALLAKIQTVKNLKIYLLSVSALLVFLIGISRIYLGVHYPTDVIAGWSIGTAWASLCWLATQYIVKLLERKKRSNLDIGKPND